MALPGAPRFYTWRVPGIWFDIGSKEALQEGQSGVREKSKRTNSWVVPLKGRRTLKGSIFETATEGASAPGSRSDK